MKVAIIAYSTYGHVFTLAKAVKQGVESSGAEVDIFQIPETLSEEVLQKMHAPAKPDFPIATNDILTSYDAFLFGFPTRFGTFPAQFKAFFDATGGLWASGALHGKPFGLFVSTGTPGGGQEVTIRNSLTLFVHQGMVYIPLGYKNAFGQITNLQEVHGSSPWGAGAFAGADGSRQPTDLELEIATIQGKTFVGAAEKFVAGASKLKAESKPAAAAAPAPASKSAPEEKPTSTEKRAAQSAPTPDVKEQSTCAKCIIM